MAAGRTASVQFLSNTEPFAWRAHLFPAVLFNCDMYVWDSVARGLIRASIQTSLIKVTRWLHLTGGFPNFNVNQVQPWLAVKRQTFVVMKKNNSLGADYPVSELSLSTLGCVSTELKDDVWLKWPGVTHPERYSTYTIHMFRNYAFHILDRTDSNLHNVFVFRLPILLFTLLSAAWKQRYLILRAALCHLVG